MDISNPNTPTPVAKTNSKKVLFPVGIVIILAILFAVGFWYFTNKPQTTNFIPKVEKVTPVASPSATISASKDPTADWKTATNSNVGYKIKYPPTWLEANATYFAPSKDLLGISNSGFGGLISISLTGSGYDINKELVLYKDHNFTDYKQIDTKVGVKKAIKLSGISQLENEAISFKGTKFIVYLVDMGEGTFILSYAQSPNWADYSKEFELMVSTFKFI